MDHVTSTDGTPIAVWRSGSGPPLLLVHGTTGDHRSMAQALPGLEQRFTVYAMDRRGRPQSGDGQDYSLDLEAQDVAAVVDWIGEPVNLLGHSFGATCSLEAAPLTDNLRSLVLYEPAFPGMDELPAAVLAKLETLVEHNEGEQALLLFYREGLQTPENLIEQIRARPDWADRVAAAHTMTREFRAENAYRPDFNRLAAIQTPTVLLVGSDSPPFAHHIAHQLNATLPNSRIVEMLGQGHLAYRTDPDGFVAAVRSAVQP